jgi:hypothetical protein
MATWTPKRNRRTVGICLMGSAEADAAVELMREEFPDASISFRDCYYKIERGRPARIRYDQAQ